MDQARSVTATFAALATLRVTVANEDPDALFPSYGSNRVTGPNGFQCSQNGTGSRSCDLTVVVGQSTALQAIAGSGDTFAAGPWASSPRAPRRRHAP